MEQTQKILCLFAILRFSKSLDCPKSEQEKIQMDVMAKEENSPMIAVLVFNIHNREFLSRV